MYDMENIAEKVSGHYYLYNGIRFENMKDACVGIGNGINGNLFKKLLIAGIVEKCYY